MIEREPLGRCAFQKRTKPDVAVIILNFNGVADTRRALESLRAALEISILPIVIDNGSEQNEAILLEAEFPEAIVERLEENLGFSRGVNYAANIALDSAAPYILLLNNDAWLDEPDYVLSQLVGALSANPSVGAAAPVILEDDGSGRVQSAGYRFSLWCPLPRAVRRGVPGTRAFTYLSACCLLVRSDIFSELAGFDPDFFLYGEDVDFGLRMRQASYSMALVPAARVRHKRGASEPSPFRAIRLSRTARQFYRHPKACSLVSVADGVRKLDRHFARPYRRRLP